MSYPVRGRGLSTGARYASPLVVFLLLGFLAPLVTVVAFAFAEPKSFEVFRSFTLANFAAVLDPSNTVWRSFAWSLGLATLCVVALAFIAYPIAYGLNRVFGRFATLISVLFVFPLFVSENVRLYGWVQFFIKNGVLDGVLKALDLVRPYGWRAVTCDRGGVFDLVEVWIENRFLVEVLPPRGLERYLAFYNPETAGRMFNTEVSI